MPLAKGNFTYDPEKQEFRERSGADHKDLQELDKLPPPKEFPEMPPPRRSERAYTQPIRPLTHEKSPFRKNFWIGASVLLLIWFIVIITQLRDASVPQGEFMSVDEVIIDPEGEKLFDVAPR